MGLYTYSSLLGVRLQSSGMWHWMFPSFLNKYPSKHLAKEHGITSQRLESSTAAS